VFRHDLPALGARYVMVFMINDRSNRRSIGWGLVTGRTELDVRTVPAGPAAGGRRARHRRPDGGESRRQHVRDLPPQQGGGGNLLITDVGNDFSKRNHLGVLHSPLSGAPDNGRCAAASFGNDGGVEYMFYEAGERLSGAIAVAKAV
jgi:hypothetical protein